MAWLSERDMPRISDTPNSTANSTPPMMQVSAMMRIVS